MGERRAEVVVLGLGPAGRAAAHRLAARGLDVLAVDPAPERRWRPTYAAWADELPDWLAPAAISTRFRPRVWARREHVVDRDYVVLSTGGLQDSLGLDGVEVVTGTVREASADEVLLADGTRVDARVVLDARGTALALDRAQQTAVGVVVPRARAEQAVGEPWLMDWRRTNGTAPNDPASFLYALPLDAESWLLEETCLVGRPALGLRELRRRLDVRLARLDVDRSGDERTEHVRFAVEPDPADDVPDGPVPFGARGGMMHPGTGYSVAVSLRLADTVADAVAAGHDLRRSLWSPAGRATRRLRQAGLRTLLSLSGRDTVAFFDAFFDLPVGLQRAYLSDRAAPRATLAAMATMARRLPLPLTAVAARSTAAELLPVKIRSRG